MKTILRGHIAEFVPSFGGRIENGQLVLDESDDLRLTVDTGFGGGIALPPKILKQLVTDEILPTDFVLANGQVVRLPVYRGIVMVNQKEIETWFIPGDSLIGMEFLASAGSALSFHLKHQTVRLAK
jgi:predicted aspartyl protease